MRSLFSRFHHHLDPGDSLGELIFGLIMVLTFTLGTRILEGGEEVDGRTLMIAALGCNIAWGLIDGFLYVLGQVYERRRLASLAASLREAPPEAARALLAEATGDDLTALADPAARDRFYDAVAAAARRTEPLTGPTAEDFRGAVTVFFLVVGTAIPAIIPFLLIADGETALRVSNAVLVALLFVIGWSWGRHVGARPWQAGLLVMSLGAAMALIAIPLGG